MGKKKFTPQTLPSDYRILLLLTLAAFDNFIMPGFSLNPEENPEVAERRHNLFNYAFSFIAPDSSTGFEIAYFCKSLDRILQYDPFEITFRLAEVYNESMGGKQNTDIVSLLNWSGDIWENVITGAKFCIQMESEATEKNFPIYYQFLQKNLRRAFRGIPQPIWEQIDCEQNLYFYYYCSSPGMNLFKSAQQPLNQHDVCFFIYNVVSQIYGKIAAIFSVIKFFHLFSSQQFFSKLSDKAANIYKLALFDRSRKAFTPTGNPQNKAILVSPDPQEKDAIFNKSFI